MNKGRLEAFSDGVLAVIITIMVLELKVPPTADIAGLRSLGPVFIAYVLSFAYVGIYWNNHHHLMRAANTIDGRTMWANLHLLFWLSLVPFGTAWVGAHSGAVLPTTLYGALLFMSGVAFSVLTSALVACNGEHSEIAVAIGNDRKGKLSLALYVIGTLAALVVPYVAYAIYFMVALIWFVPDRRVERVLATRRPPDDRAS